MAACNVKYDKKSYQQLASDLKLLYNQINRPGIEDRIIKTLEFKYKSKDGQDKRLLLTDSENLDETSREFIDDVNNIVCGLANASLDKLPEKAMKFRNIVLSTFFDMNSVGEVTTQISETEKEMETDESQEARKLQKVEDTLLEIYGPINTGLIQEVTDSFGRELKQKLIYNNYLKTKYELTSDEVNKRIVDYKEGKFESILGHLKEQFPNDSTLQSITSMYSNGMLNSSQYYYVIDTFRKYVLQDPDRNTKFNQQLEDKILQKNKVQQEYLYRQLIKTILNNPKLNTWFNNKYNTNYTNSEAKTQLFMANRFSNYYLEIKDKLLKEIERGAEFKDEVLPIIQEIENPKDDLLNYVNDYIVLTQFDDLLAQKLGSSIGIERGFLNNVEPQRQNAKKYALRESHAHQKAGWETANNEGSEAHTSTGVKDMLDTIFVYKYNESHQLLPQTLNMTSLMQAWQSLLSDVLNNNINFDTSNSEAVVGVLKDLINTQNVNVLDNIVDILEILFKPQAIQNSRGRMIDFMRNENLFSEQHKNILYSFYNEILNKDNPNSNISIELGRVNDNLKYGTKFLETVSDLCAIIYRNVNNNYIDCNLQSSKSLFAVKKKFNWDADLFDSVERITFRSKTRQINKLGEDRLSKYNYTSVPDQTGKFISKVELPGKEGTLYTFGFRYNQGASNMEGLFSTMDNLELENSTVSINGKEVPMLDILAGINLRDFSNKVLQNKELLNEYETVLNNLLEMFDYYLDTNFLSDKGLEALQGYKDKYTYDPKNNLFSKNYLNHFLKLAIRTADIDNQVKLAGDQDMKQFLMENSKYTSLFNRESKKPSSNVFDIQANRVYFKPVTTSDKALSDLAKSFVEASGRSVRSTSLNKAGSSVSNYSISRLGSELNRRLHKQRQEGGPANSLLFVQNPNAIDIDPVIDGEITTPIGDVKAVRDMSSSELFQHAILDKFYSSFLKTGRICFQPTVYSDKTNFLNYMSNLSMFSDNIMDLMSDKSQEFVDLYRNTFFSAHNQIQANVVTKMEKLMSFLTTEYGAQFRKEGDVFTSNRLDNVRTFLRNRTESDLISLVFSYNQHNLEKIELEKDKDYRNRKKFCDLNEITDFYAKLYNEPVRLKKFLKQQQELFLENLREYGVNFRLFDSTQELNSWINNKLNEKAATQTVRLLSDTKLLQVKDRQAFADKWIDKETGELLLQKDSEMNPFLEKFFYIEGLFSNNLRLSLSGTEINHPDKAKGTLFNKIVSAVNDIKGAIGNPIKTNVARKALENILNNNKISFSSLDNFIEEFSSMRAINDLDGKPNMQDIYDKTIIEIINTAQGTQFKRNVIIPATLQHPLTGLINGVASKVNAAVAYDMSAPVNNLRESDEIDSQDGSSTMSPIQVILENNSLGDQRVGTNRKPIWDDQTGDLTSFLAKFASFGQTNAMMLQSLQSNSAQYNMFKKMHNIRWNGAIDLTKNINQFQQTAYDQEEVSRWFREAILGGEKLFYKNQLGEIVQVTDFGKDNSGYFTVETILGKGSNKIYHYFSDNTSEHSTVGGQGFHTIDSLYELFVALGGINCTNAKGVTSEFSNQVLTNFVINVGYKVNPKVTSINDIVQPLKDKFVAYVFNNSAVKNGAKNINSKDVWTNNVPLNTFQLNIQGLGIQLNADHDVVDSELTEFSQVVAACAAYGKDYKSVNEIYYGLAESAFQASEQELTNIQRYFKDYAEDPSKAKYQLYKIVGKLIVQSKSNSDMDLTEKLKQEINKEFKVNKDNSSSGLKIPFSDPSIYTQFITNITSVINSKSIKRKHPGSGYVMAPGYNVVQYFQWFDPKTKTYRKYLFEDVLKRARNDFKGKLRSGLEAWCAQNGVDPNKYGERKRRISSFDLATLIQESSDKIDTSLIPYLGITSQDTTEYNRQLVNMFLASKQEAEQVRDKSWFMPTDIVNIIKNDGTVISHDLSDMADFFKFKNGIFDIEDEYNVKINQKGNKFTITLNEDENSSFVIEKEIDSDKWNIHFKTGGRDSNLQRRTPWVGAKEDQKIRLFNAALQVLPNGAILRLSPTTQEQLDTKIGGLTKGSIVGYQSIIENEQRHSGVNLEVVSEPYTVSYFDKSNQVKSAQVREYKKISNVSKHTYKLNITKPNNLKPSLLRWQYVDPTDGVTKYMTIYDHPIIRGSWNLPKSERPKQTQIQDVLDLLDEGKFELNGQTLDIVPGSLENTEAEIVLGNMYKDIFQTGDATLADIMDQGENFFRKQTEVPKIPAGFYNLAFVKNNGQHTLVSFSNLIETLNIYEDPFDYTQEYINDNNEIYTHQDGIKIGKYIQSSWKYSDGKVLDQNNQEIDKSRYRLIQDENGNVENVLQRIDYVKRYKYTKSELVNGEQQLINYTLYKIAPVQDIRNALDKKSKDQDVLNSDAFHQISSILNNIYSQDKYIDIQVNTGIELNPDLRRTIANSLVDFGNDTKYDRESNKRVLMTPEEIQKLPRFQQHMIELRNALIGNNFQEQYRQIRTSYYEYLQQYKKQYSSFLTSLHFISSRIPAQSLQSFMPMTCVGWTADTSNTAYVSYIQTYLQGSDYDIDKAYVMGQSFSDDAMYIGWSPLFNYSSEQMVDASKTLPLPRGNKLIVVEGEQYSIENELNSILSSSGPERLRKMANLIYKIDSNNGRYNYIVGENADQKQKIIEQIQKHENYKVSYRQREQAYKNVASANIRNVVHNIRNRDQAYSPITMRDLQKEADKSPKGAKTKQLNMMNPLTKYVMQNQNLVGKNVIGIAANGEKDWFNLTYYYHNVLRNGNQKDRFFLKMSHSYSRLSGRATDQLMNVVVKHIPDLWNASPELSQKIKEEFYATYDGQIDMDDKYVDQLISQILSAATDNAKELILAKINAGTNLAKYHLHLVMMGFNLKDIVAFMTSPVVELIDKYSRNDLYKNQTSSVTNAIKTLNGDIDLSKLIVNPQDNLSPEERIEAMESQMEAMEAEADMMMELMAEGRTPRRVNNEYSWVIKELGSMYKTAQARSLKDFVQKYIKAKTEPLSANSPEFMVALSNYELPVTSNMNTNYVFRYIDQIVNDIRSQIEDYNRIHPNSNYSMLDFKLDLNEFQRITDEANETSTLASVWLKLNQGIPQTDMDLIKLIKRMYATVSTRERRMDIKKPVDSNKQKFVNLSDEEDIVTGNSGTKQELLQYLEKYSMLPTVPEASKNKTESGLIKTIKSIQGNNPELSLAEIVSILEDAVRTDLYGNFDLYKFLNDEKVVLPQSSRTIYNTRQGDLVSYRELAATYYNLIKSSWNILDMVNRIPHYKMNLDLLNYTLQQRHLFANKSKIVDQLISLGELSYSALSDRDYKNIIQYADKILITSYFLSKEEPIDISKVDDTKVYDSNYDLVRSDELYLNSLNGIDSLKNFVENNFFEWLKNTYPDNFLVKELVQSSNRGKSMLRTALNLFEIDQSLTNKQTYNRYLIGIQELVNEKFDQNHSVADILMLYNLAVNGTRLGGKYMTGIFRDQVREGNVLYDYYKFMSEQDYNDDFKYIMPTKRDFLIAMAPTVYSTYALNYRTEPYVKVLNPAHGYDVYKRYYDKSDYTWKYDMSKPESLLQLDHLGLTQGEIDERTYNYAQNSLVMFPELHKRLRENSIFSGSGETNMKDKVLQLAQYIRQNRLLIYKLC